MMNVNVIHLNRKGVLLDCVFQPQEVGVTGKGSPSPETAPRSPGSFWLPRKPRDARSSEKLTDVIYKFLMEAHMKELRHSVELTFLHPSSSSTHSKGHLTPCSNVPLSFLTSAQRRKAFLPE